MTRLTRRGIAVLCASVLAFAMAGLFGARALNAVVVPAWVALALGAIQLRRADTPRVERHVPEPGFPGERKTVSLVLETERPVLATVTERAPAALSPDQTRFETTLGTTLTYDIEPNSRGVYTTGPLSVALTDTLGLFTRKCRFTERDSIVVYPPVARLSGPGRNDLSILADVGRTRDRQAFDHLREYERGDSLRDIHWKTSAKRADEEFVVTQFVAESDPGGITVAAESGYHEADDLACAAASLAMYVLESGVSVGLVLGDEVVERGDGPDQHHALLSALARTEGGRVDAEADVRIEVREGKVIIVSEDDRTTFDSLVGEVPA